ncbi:Splicing factor U2af large subunit [Phytophthora palmivora]|uniref:Splicing factor U2af large subunit n=1 Tax=Phytophthora palmivora TaxID=4796 RepID=A0A2P4XUL8_9STRA|nr:Splicing factor U2af large subunit [Phytophthora palmivora]
MARSEEGVESERRHGRHKAFPSPTRGEDDEESIRNKLRESGWKKRRPESESAADVEASKDKDKGKEKAVKSSPRGADDRRSSRTSRSSRRSRSPRRRDREHRSSRRKSSGSRRRSTSRSRSPASRSRSRSRSAGRRRRRHTSSSRKRRSLSRSRDARESKRSRHKSRSQRSRSGSPRSPSRSSRRRRHRRNSSYSRSRSPSRSRRARRPSRSRSRSIKRDRRSPPAATPSTGVNPTITQLMAQYPTMSLQDIIAKMQASNVTMAAAVAQKPARELYVGNLPPNVTGPQLQEFLSTIIQQVGLTTQPGNPIINTWISTDGHFAFCEMRSVEECNLALLLNQLSLLGQPLKFGRPRSFMGPPQPMPLVSARTQTALTNLGCTPNPAWFAQSSATDDAIVESSTLLAAVAAAQSMGESSAMDAGSAHRLIMSNIPVVLTEDQVKELVEPFGALKNFTLVKDTTTGASLGSALFEYEDNDVASQAVEGLNGLSIGGILLSVQRQPPSTGATLVANPEDQTSAVLKMANMVSIDELRDDEEYADLAEDVEEECKRFGSVAGMEIPRPKDGEEVPGLGCIYVRFGKEEDAVSALKALNGRKFGGNIVKVTYFPLDKFEKHELS